MLPRESARHLDRHLALTGSSNLYRRLKLARDSKTPGAESETKMSARKALELGTIGGAQSMGIDDKWVAQARPSAPT